MALRSAVANCDVLFATTLKELPEEFDAKPFIIIPDCNRNALWLGPWAAIVILFHILRFRPDAVISTGALPGLLALGVARVLRVRTVWIDSIANAEEMSMSGKLARRVADLRLSQWKHVADAEGADYMGAII
ncbi:MAG: UDP-N-acetylglucosamine--LPS N-acetylglucosamine transferase [Paracoccaceae bacterium]